MANQNFPSSLNPVGNMLTQPVVPVAGVQPQADPGLWKTFLANLAANPNLQQSLLTTGLSLMGDPMPGESGFGTFSRAALGGVQNYNRMNEIDRQRRIQQQQLELQQQNIESLDESRKAMAKTAEERTGVMRSGVEQRAQETAARILMARDQLTNNLEVARIRAEGTNKAASAGATGAERMQAAAAQYYIDAGFYPDTKEGRARANLAAAGLTGEVNPDTRLRVLQQQLEMLDQENFFKPEDQRWSAEEMNRMATQAVDAFIYSNPRGQTPAEQDLTGKTFAGPGGSVTVIKVGPDEYRLMNAQNQPSKGTYSRADLVQLAPELGQ